MDAECRTIRPEHETAGENTTAQLLSVRNAILSDAEPIAGILAEAFPSLYRSTFGPRKTSEIILLLQALYDARHLSLDDTRVCELDGSVVGVMILHTGMPIGRGSAGSYWSLLNARFGPLRAPRMFFGGIMANLMLDRRVPRAPDLVYIEALAVAERHRGKGIGSRLLADAEQWTRAAGRSRLALHVLASNTGARRLYHRVGFRPRHERAAAPHWQTSLMSSAWTAILMYRSLAPDTDAS